MCLGNAASVPQNNTDVGLRNRARVADFRLGSVLCARHTSRPVGGQSHSYYRGLSPLLLAVAFPGTPARQKAVLLASGAQVLATGRMAHGRGHAELHHTRRSASARVPFSVHRAARYETMTSGGGRAQGMAHVVRAVSTRILGQHHAGRRKE